MSAQSAILTYHSLDRTGSVISIPPELFRRHIEALLARKVPIVTLEQALKRSGCVALTFDDGFENFIEHALPTLAEYKLPATVFVVTGYCGQLNTWPTQPKSGIPALRLMNWRQLQELPDYIALGGHTTNHPDLGKVPLTMVADEVTRCRSVLEDRTGRPVRLFAYPYGSSTHVVRNLVREHFPLAYGTALDFVGPNADLLNLPRIDAYYMRQWLSADRLLAPSGRAYIAFRGFLRTIRAQMMATL
jgi:peptidoglycan/xylan/chitin deacetylase (PgdA/CDA1 family)